MTGMLIYIGLGIIAGIMAGILGIGGGVVVVPGLVFLFKMTQTIPAAHIMQVAAATSLATMIFTAQASLRAHHALTGILWPVFFRLLPGILIGAILGALAAPFVPVRWFEILFSVFLCLIAINVFFKKPATHSASQNRSWGFRMASAVIGLQSGLLGVGGGLLIIPFLTSRGIPIRNIPALSNSCNIAVAVVGTIVFIITGWHVMSVVPYTTGYVYWPAVFWIAIFSSISAPIGAKLNHLLSAKQLQYILIMVLILTAIDMLF